MNTKTIVLLAALVVAVSAVDPRLVAQKNDEIRTAYVNELNSLPGMTWTAGINERFRGAPLEAARSLCGVKPESKKILEQAIADGRVVRPRPSLDDLALPVAFDSAENWPHCKVTINDIRDQSNCGCCWAFGAAEAASDRMCIATNGSITLPLSAQETCFCASSAGCDGGDLFTPWSFIQSNGIVTGGQNNETGPFKGMCSDFSLPHCHHHGPQRNDPYPDEGAPGCPSVQQSPQCPTSCDSTAQAPHNQFSSDKYTFQGQVSNYGPDENSIMKAIMTDGPVEAAFTVYADFENYVSGVYQHKSGGVLGGHAIKIVGWGVDSGVKYWKIANSWNPYWGENGYFRIIRGVDNCGIEDQITASSPGATWAKMSDLRK